VPVLVLASSPCTLRPDAPSMPGDMVGEMAGSMDGADVVLIMPLRLGRKAKYG
jgi:hypothetical protein